MDPSTIRALCSAARFAPDTACELLQRQEDIFIPFDAQQELGAAALEHPEIGGALVHRWRSPPQSALVTSFPGLALDSLAATGDADAVNVYAEWLPNSLAMTPLVPAFCPPSQGALAQVNIRRVACRWVRQQWDEANAGRLFHGTLVNHLYGLWPAWEDDPVVREGLIQGASSGDDEQLDMALAAWLNGSYPEPVTRALAHKLRGWGQEVAGAVDFWGEEGLGRLIAAAQRAGILAEFEPLLVGILESPQPSRFAQQVAVHLLALRPERASHWSARAAATWPSATPTGTAAAARDEALMIALAPRAWAKRCLFVLEQVGPRLAPQFLRLARVLLGHLGPSTLRRGIIKAVRALAEHDPVWVRRDNVSTFCVNVGDAAREVLFLIGEPVAGPHTKHAAK